MFEYCGQRLSSEICHNLTVTEYQPADGLFITAFLHQSAFSWRVLKESCQLPDAMSWKILKEEVLASHTDLMVMMNVLNYSLNSAWNGWLNSTKALHMVTCRITAHQAEGTFGAFHYWHDRCIVKDVSEHTQEWLLTAFQQLHRIIFQEVAVVPH